MKLTTFTKRIAATRITKQSMAYKLAKSLLTDGGPVRTCWTSGSGRFTSNLDYTNDTIVALEAAGLCNGKDFELKNDAPKGGKAGNFITLTASGRRKMIAD